MSVDSLLRLAFDDIELVTPSGVFIIPNKELGLQPLMRAGDRSECPACRAMSTVRERPDHMLFVECYCTDCTAHIVGAYGHRLPPRTAS